MLRVTEDAQTQASEHGPEGTMPDPGVSRSESHGLRIPVLYDIDDGGEGGCGSVAFYSLGPLTDYNRLPLHTVDALEMPDGTKPEIGRYLTCGHCGAMWLRKLTNVCIISVMPAQELTSTSAG